MKPTVDELAAAVETVRENLWRQARWPDSVVFLHGAETRAILEYINALERDSNGWKSVAAERQDELCEARAQLWKLKRLLRELVQAEGAGVVVSREYSMQCAYCQTRDVLQYPRHKETCPVLQARRLLDLPDAESPLIYLGDERDLTNSVDCAIISTNGQT
jgi:hypothetical protein